MRRFLALALLVAACSPAAQPATTPTFNSTTTTVEVTTTLDRLAEIEAIYQDLEERRLDALYRGDRDAFRALHVDNGYLEESMQLFELVEFDGPPLVQVEVLEVLHDGADCMAFEERVFRPDLGQRSDPRITVLEFLNGAWLISFGGSGWACDGPHPLS